MVLELTDNPMLDSDLPDFKAINPSLFISALDSMLNAGESLINNTSEELPSNPSWENVIEPYLHFNMVLNKLISIASHLESVLDDKQWREAYVGSIGRITDFSTKLTHNKNIYKLFKAFQNHDIFNKLTPERKHLVDDYIRDVELEGVNLPNSDKASLQKINSEISKAKQQFQNNVLDSTDSWSTPVDRMSLIGVPLNVVDTLDFDNDQENYNVVLRSDVVQAVLGHSKERSLREVVYKAWVSRASEIGPGGKKFDNSKLINGILGNRHKTAKILGFPSYSHLSLANKDAESPEKVIMFLESLGEKAKKYALKEKDELLKFAKDELKLDDVKPWDLSFISEQMKKRLLGYSEDEISQYFPVDHVLDCLLSFAAELFGIKFVKTSAISTYSDDAYVYYALDRNGKVLGNIYFDLFSRKGKKCGAWVSSFQDKAEFVSESYNPAVFLVCNFSPADNYESGLLNHDDVVTLFHEFGHAMHCMLTKIKTYGISGFSGVAWDLVEWPSQWMETWCWSKRILDYISSHYRTKEVMPLDMVESMNQARTFQSGMFVTRQVQFALTDMIIHSATSPMKLQDALAVYHQVAERFSVWPVFEGQRFLNSFSHIFAGGYAAGYYSYLWSEAMVADSFWSMGDQNTLNFSEVGENFKNYVLAHGAMLKVEPAFKQMFNRPMNPDMLLVHLGLE